jgi:hypothetical protein
MPFLFEYSVRTRRFVYGDCFLTSLPTDGVWISFFFYSDSAAAVKLGDLISHMLGEGGTRVREEIKGGTTFFFLLHYSSTHSNQGHTGQQHIRTTHTHTHIPRNTKG